MFSIFRFFFPFFTSHPHSTPAAAAFAVYGRNFLYMRHGRAVSLSREARKKMLGYAAEKKKCGGEGKRNFHQWKCFSRSVLCSLFCSFSLRLSPSFAYLISYTSPSTHHELEQLSPRPDTRWKRNSRKNKEAEESSGAARERERSRRVRENNNIIKINKNM